MHVRITWDLDGHRRKRCSDAARMGLGAKRSVWTERLGQQHYAGAWVGAYSDAIRRCEAYTWRDRRALLRLILQRAGTIPAMIEVYQAMADPGVRSYLREQILRRVRTADELRRVRTAFGSAVDHDALVEQLLERAPNNAERLRVLHRLTADYPEDLELALRLMRLLELTDNAPAARRLADRLRVEPLADAGVRTAIGELLLRLGDEADARRAFSEIVEMNPQDATARRRLGDLYRAHGWFEDAYRQYQTLATIQPSDSSVLLLLAQAAAGVGRVDEALRLEQKVIETSGPGATGGLARMALLWSSVRFAELRQSAESKRDALLSRMRRSGVLGEASALRVSLVWSHPDAGLALWASHPGGRLRRPTDIGAEFGIEAFDVREQERGPYAIEVVRTGSDGLTRIDAKLVVVWNEGQHDEKIEIVPVRFEGSARAFAWRIDDQSLTASSAHGGAR